MKPNPFSRILTILTHAFSVVLRVLVAALVAAAFVPPSRSGLFPPSSR